MLHVVLERNLRVYLLPIIALEKVSHNRDIQLLFGLKKRSIGHEALLLLLTKVVL